MNPPLSRLGGEAALDVLPGTQGEQVLLNQDLHGDNVLRAARAVAVDRPQTPARRTRVLRSAELGHSREQVLRRLDRLIAELGLDRERARLWMLGSTIAWAIDGPSTHVEVARWLSER